MKKILSAALALALALSSTSVTVSSVLASAEYPDVFTSPETYAGLFTGNVDYPRAENATGTHFGKSNVTLLTPWYTDTSDPEGKGARNNRGIALEGYGRIPVNNSLLSVYPEGKASAETLTDIYKYCIVDYYYEVDGEKPYANLYINGLASKGTNYNNGGLTLANTKGATADSATMFANRWASAVVEFGSGYMFQYHLYPFGNNTKGSLLSNKDRIALAKMTWCTDVPEGINQFTEVKADKIAPAFGSEPSEFPTVKVATVTSDSESDAISVSGDASVTPYASVGAYIKTYNGDYAEAIDVTFTLTVGDKVYNAKATQGNMWVSVDFGSIAAAGAFDTVKLAVSGLTTGFAAYIYNINFETYERTWPYIFSVPKFDRHGNLIPELEGKDYVADTTTKQCTNLISDTCDMANVADYVEAAFPNGTSAKIVPNTAGTSPVSVTYKTMLDGDAANLNSQWWPYVRVEYYIYARDTDAAVSGAPVLKIGKEEFVSENPLVFNQWATAYFNIGKYDTGSSCEYDEFTYLPYGKNNANTFNEWNKAYIADVTLSQTNTDKSAPSFANPEMTEEGENKPYYFTSPDGKPVVYVNNGGTYKGDYTGSTDSTKAYGSIDDAIMALSGVGGYIILCDNITLGRGYHLKAHNDFVTIRGKDKDDGSKVSLNFNYMNYTSGPMGFENIDLRFTDELQSSNDDSIISDKYLLVLGKEGVANDITFSGKKPTITGANVVINSAEIATIRLATWGSKPTFDSVNITLNGGSLGTIAYTWATGGGTTEVTGDYNLTVNGGTLGAKAMPGTISQPSMHVGGDVNFVITGGTINGSGMKFITDPSMVTVDGKKKIDILAYSGPTKNLKSLVSEPDWDILNINSIYVSDDGSDTNNGSSASTAVQTLERAYELLSVGSNPNAVYSGKIVVSGAGLSLADGDTEPEHKGSVSYECEGSAKIKLFGMFNFTDDATIIRSNISIEDDSIPCGFAANGNKLVIDEDVNVTGKNGNYVTIVGGSLEDEVEKVDVTVKSGKFSDILAGSDVKGDVNITIDGGEVNGKIVGGSSADGGEIGGSSTITINDGEINGSVIAGSDAADASVEGNAVINVNGGEFGSKSEIIIMNTDPSDTIGGTPSLNITDGDFSGMTAGAIKGGAGESDGNSNVNYTAASKEVANALDNAINADSIKVVIRPAEDKPGYGGNKTYWIDNPPVIFIINISGDPYAAFSKAVPFKISQTALQSKNPIVVTPKQINIKMDGSDHTNNTIQTVNDVETVRLVPNPNFTTGRQIVQDGWNISGRGVLTDSYKYAEVVYYYTVPEGDTPAATEMTMNVLKPSAGTITSTPLVANKWATVLFDFTEAFADKSEEVKQYHFFPFGSGKTGTSVPENQYLDIISLTFYADKPSTSVTGGKAPSTKAVAAKTETPKPIIVQEKVEDINVGLSKIKGTVDKSGVFEASDAVLDGVGCVEYVPAIDNSKNFTIEGYNCMGKKIDTNVYQYVTMNIYYKTSKTSSDFVPAIRTLAGGMADDPNVTKSVVYSADKPLTPNEWGSYTICIKPADATKNITQQFHIMPCSESAHGNSFSSDERIYISSFVISANPPKAPKAEGEEEEVIEEESEIIADAPAVVLGNESIYASSTSVRTFKSAFTTFEDKSVVAITPISSAKPVTIDCTNIFDAENEQTPNGALNLKTHRYAVISYYYKTSADSTTSAPVFELLGNRIHELGSVTNGVKAEGSALKTNQWATAVVKLSGNGEGNFTSGFNFMPFGTKSSQTISSGDVLYIENITFVSNRP